MSQQINLSSGRGEKVLINSSIAGLTVGYASLWSNIVYKFGLEFTFNENCLTVKIDKQVEASFKKLISLSIAKQAALTTKIPPRYS